MSWSKRFFVPGRPLPKGSMRQVFTRGSKRPVLIHDNPKLKAWQRAVETHAGAFRPERPIEGPVIVDLVFWFKPPSSDPERRHPIGMEGDVDKHARLAFDALQNAGIVADDRQIVGGKIWKAISRHREGVEIEIRTLDVEQTLSQPQFPSLRSV